VRGLIRHAGPGCQCGLGAGALPKRLSTATPHKLHPAPPPSAPNCTHAAQVLDAARPRTWAGFRPVWDCTFCDTESTRARRGDKRVKWGCGCIGSHHRRMNHGGVGAKRLCRRASDTPTASKGTWEANGRGGGSCAVLGCATWNGRNWWVAACPLLDDGRRKCSFVHTSAQSARTLIAGKGCLTALRNWGTVSGSLSGSVRNHRGDGKELASVDILFYLRSE